MQQHRSIRAPKAENKTKKTRVHLLKVDMPEMGSVDIVVPTTMKQLLTEATFALKLVRPAQQALDQNGIPITDIKKIKNGDTITISCSTPIDEEAVTEAYKSRLPHSRKLPLAKQPKPKPMPQNAAQHQAIAANPYTVKETLRNSILSLYSSLNSEQKSQLSYNSELSQFFNETQNSLLRQSLMSQYIGPTSTILNSPLGHQTMQYAISQLKGKKVQDCKFIITGPSKSGKSTLLSSVVTAFHQKLLISEENGKYLIIPINWTIPQIYVTDVQKLYEFFVKTTLDAIRITKMELIPILDILQHWFISIVQNSTLPPLPPPVSHFNQFPHDAVMQIGVRIHRTWSSKSNFESFLERVVFFPSDLSHALGFTNPIYVYDHYDACDFEISPPERFRDEEPIHLASLIAESLENCPFFLSSLDDTQFFRVFTSDAYQQLPTERIVPVRSQKELTISKPYLSISEEMCRGCPGYCAMLDKIMEMAEKFKPTQPKGQYARVKSVADQSRKELLKQELIRFCILLAPSDVDDRLNDVVLDDLMAQEELDVRVH